jgi:uridine phosphorylase
MEYPASELVLNDHGRVYHLDLSPEMVADKIILVGDPDRVAMVAKFFDSVEFSSNHREFTSKTGMYKGKRVTALSTGIGIGNIDITVNELDSLVNIDLHARRHKDTIRSLEIVRIGTCGILQADIPVHSYVLSAYAFGIDNVADFYDIQYKPDEVALNAAINASVYIPTAVNTYAAKASPLLVSKLESEQTVKGITVTSCGFYGPQGTDLITLPTQQNTFFS